jgi:oxygen-independent coproporphyrinogen-3 oxidase
MTREATDHNDMLLGAPAGLYVHIPFCETKCGYCDFYSVPLRGRATGPVVDRVCRELSDRVAIAGLPLRTVFIGGGTPTLLPFEELARLLQTINDATHSYEIEEFTVEANPATVEPAKAGLLTRCGVNRVSMGAQSFFPAELAVLERIHSPEDIAPSVSFLRDAGVPCINLDLIFGIPGQTMHTWRESLNRAIGLNVEHIACYALTYEPGTPLTARLQHGRITPCEEDLEAEMHLRAVEVLAEAGFLQYEISNFAKPGCECRHNLIYWRNEPYIGVGPSAAGCYGGRRYKNVSDNVRYVRMFDERGHAEMESEVISPSMLVTEMILMQLRLNEGLSIARFRERTGLDPVELFDGALNRVTNLGLLTVSDCAIALTRSGRLVANDVMAELAAAADVRMVGPATVERR